MSQDDEVHALIAAATDGDANAQNDLGYRYESGEGVEQDHSLAHKWHTKAAEQGHADSLLQLGRLYYFGIGVNQNATTALRWYEQSADRGSSSAQNNLGLMYFNGEVVEQNLTAAFELFKRAAEAGNKDAQNNLGAIYLNGQLGEPDLGKAIEMFTKSANQSHKKAQLSLGIMYLNGTGVEQSDSKAQYWLSRSAEQGEGWAQMHLGRLYTLSEGEHRNLEEGIRWLRRSLEQGNPQAKKIIEYAESVLQSEKEAASEYTRISQTLYLTVNGTALSESTGGLNAGEQSSYVTRPGEYRKDLQTIDDLIQSIEESAVSRHEWISCLKIDDFDLVRHTVVEVLKAAIFDEKLVVDSLVEMPFFSSADSETLCKFVQTINKSFREERNLTE